MNKIEICNNIYKEKLLKVPKDIKRNYFNQLIKVFENYNLVLIGLRQVGKTTLAEQIINHFINKYKNEDEEITELNTNTDNFLYLNLVFFQKIDETLVVEIQKYINELKPRYCFIDEIQKIKNWSNFCQSVIDANKETKFIFSGSNAYAFKNESMFNRAKIFTIKPLSWLEFKKIWKSNKIIDFFKYGSYPPSNNQENVKANYVNMIEESIIDKIVVKDINEEKEVIRLSIFKQFIEKIKNRIGQAIKISKDFQDIVSRPNVNKYINLLIDSKLILRIFKYENYPTSNPKPKIYLQDKSMMYYFNNYEDLNANDWDSLIENIVFNQIDFWLNKEYQKDEIFFYNDDEKKEIDFIILKYKTLIEVKFVENFNIDEEIAKYEEISKNLKGYRKIMITKNKTQKINDWELISLEEFLEKEEKWLTLKK